MAVDGSAPDGLGVVWLPRTAGGDGDEPGARGDGLLTGVGDADGGLDCAAALEGDAVTVAGDAVCVTAGDGPVELAETLGLVSGAAGPSATRPVDVAANTAAPSATSPASTAIGTRPIRLPRGRGSRQLGQKPETGVVT